MNQFFLVGLTIVLSLTFANSIGQENKLMKESVTYYDDVNYFNQTIDTIQNFSNDTINAKIYGFDVYFIKEVYFYRTSFQSPFTLKYSHFKDYTTFDKARFNSESIFSSSSFENVSFSGTQFFSGVKFDCCRFKTTPNFAGTKFMSTCDFSHAHFEKKVDFLHSQFNLTATFFKTEFYLPVSFQDVYFRSKVEFNSAKFKSNADLRWMSFLSEAIFDSTKFNSVDFSYSKFDSTVSFQKVEFKAITNFYDVYFNHLAIFSNSIVNSYISFSNAQLPKIINFRDTRVNGIIDLSGAKVDSIPSGICKINLVGADINKFKLRYTQFKLDFYETDSKDLKASVYEQLLARTNELGFKESYKKLDIEYKQLLYSMEKSRVSALINWVDKYWWNYGYNKELIFINTAIIFIFFIIVNSFFLNSLNKKVYSIENIPVVDKNKIGSRVYYSLFYTGFIFFSLKFSISNLHLSKATVLKNLGFIWFFFIYIAGIICLAYMANYIITV